VVSAPHAHTAVVTNYRPGVPDVGMPQCCQDTIRNLSADVGAELREFNGEDDHVHLLVDYPPKAAIPAPVNSLMAASAQRLRSEATGQVNRQTMHRHFWSPSYLAASCGDAPPGVIRQYIEQQRRPVNATSGLTPP
jgi:putative transposase